MWGRGVPAREAQPNSPAALGHPLQKPALTLWSDARLRAACAPSPAQRALAKRQPHAMAAVSLAVWLPTVAVAGFILPGNRDVVAWVMGAAVVYPFLLLLTAVGSRLLASSPGAPALELARRVGQAPMSVYEDDARVQLDSVDGPVTALLLRTSERTEVLLRVFLYVGPRGRYERVCSRPLKENVAKLGTRHNAGELTPREADALWDLVTSWAELPAAEVQRMPLMHARRLQLSVLRRDTRTVQRWDILAPPHQRAFEVHPAVQMASFLSRMEETRRAFPDQTWETPE